MFLLQDGGLGKLDIPLLADYKKTISQDYDVLLDEGFALRGKRILTIVKSKTSRDIT